MVEEQSVAISASGVVGNLGACALWPVDPACFSTEWFDTDPEVQERALLLASATLERLTAYRVRNCPVTVRPCKRGCAVGISQYQPAYGNALFTPQINAYGNWINSCGCTTTCSCSPLCEVRLPGPVGRVDEVKVDGLIISPEFYRIDNGNLLVWTALTECPWPTCQELALPDTEVGTFSVTYLNANPVDALGAYAVGVLAIEFARACSGGPCRLPAGVTMIARQGITMEITSGAFPNGMTGIREVDTYIAIWNPDGLQREASVWSPDLPRTRVTTWGQS